MDLDAIRKRARADLLITRPHGDPDVFLWEHSVRVAENARRIARLPEVRARSPHEDAIVVAGLYHDAGWVTRVDCGEIDPVEVLLGPTSQPTCEQSALILERSLRRIIPPDVLNLSAETVRCRNDRSTESVEAHVVAEADALDEFGVLPLWLLVRRGVADGKGVQATIDAWHRKKEYRFWGARLKDSFRYNAVRELARARLERLERFMSEIRNEHTGKDVIEALEPDSAGSEVERSSM